MKCTYEFVETEKKRFKSNPAIDDFRQSKWILIIYNYYSETKLL